MVPSQTAIPLHVWSKWCRQFCCPHCYWCLCVHQCVAMVHSVSLCASPPPPSSSMVRPECLSVDEAEGAASAAQLG